MGKRHTPRNTPLPGGAMKLSRSAVYRKKALYKKKKTVTKKVEKPTVALQNKTIGGAKNGGSRLVAAARASRFYPTEDVPKPLASRNPARPAKLRSSLQPGTVVILLAGRFRGKRAVFLKQLPSGLLLVTGPFKVSGVPLRRVNQVLLIRFFFFFFFFFFWGGEEKKKEKKIENGKDTARRTGVCWVCMVSGCRLRVFCCHVLHRPVSFVVQLFMRSHCRLRLPALFVFPL